jgi:hypothetical protein
MLRREVARPQVVEVVVFDSIAKYRRNMADPEKKAKERARIRHYKRQQRAKEKT